MPPACLTFLALALATGILSADGPNTYASPDGRYILTTQKNEAERGYKVLLVDAKARRILDRYNPETRAIGAIWSSDSKYVAVGEDISHATSRMEIWRVAHGHLEAVELPAKLRDIPYLVDKAGDEQVRESISNFLSPQDEAHVLHWWGAHSAEADEWLNPSDLRDQIIAEGEMDEHRTIAINYDLVIRCKGRTSTLVSETKRRYEITPEK